MLRLKEPGRGFIPELQVSFWELGSAQIHTQPSVCSLRSPESYGGLKSAAADHLPACWGAHRGELGMGTQGIPGNDPVVSRSAERWTFLGWGSRADSPVLCSAAWTFSCPVGH